MASVAGKAVSPGRKAGGLRLRSIRTRLLFLTASLLLPAIIVAAFLLWRTYVQEHRAAEQQLSDTARALSLVVDREIGQSRVLLDALAASDKLTQTDLAPFEALARAANRDPDRWILVVDKTGQQLVTTLPHAPGQPLPKIANFARTNGFRRLSDGTRLWNIFYDRRSKQQVVSIARTIALADGREGRLAVVTPAASFSRVFREQGLTERWLGTIIDASAHIVARNRQNQRFVGTIATQEMQRRIAANPKGVEATVTLDKVASITAWNRSDLTGWAFIVAVPRGDLAAGARASFRVGALLGLVLLGLGAIVSFRVGRGVSEPVEQLAAQAAALGRGEDPPPVHATLDEVAAVEEALRDASAALRRREGDLELRVIERTRELAEATDNLVQAQKMEAIGRLTGGIAHDFNNLLTAILGNIDLIERRNEDPRVARQLAGARQAAERGAKLTGQLLAFSRRQHLKAEAVDANTAVENTVGLLRSTLGGAITVEHDLAGGLWRASADPTQLDLILLNLAINARDAMPTGGSIAISTRNVSRGPASVPEEPGPGDYVAIAVADRGTGMPPEIVARVFEPFFTTKPVGQGTGLGLPQVLGVLKQLSGGIGITSRVGEGTTVTIYLPRSSAIGIADTPAPAPRGGDLRGVRVLLVDDDPDVRGVAAALLRELGAEVSEHSGGAAAVDTLLRGASPDMVLLDFAMPGMNGAETAAAIRALQPELPILLMSGFADVDALSELWDGALLPKPFTAASLEAGVADAVKAHRVVRLRRG